MKLITDECDICGLVLPVEDITIHEARDANGWSQPVLSECDLCAAGVGLKEFYPADFHPVLGVRV
jgi:hypothetical protein